MTGFFRPIPVSRGPREMRRDTDGRDGRFGETVIFLNDEDNALLFGVFDKSKQQIAI